MDCGTGLNHHGHEIRRLRTLYPRDYLLRALLALDLAIRRLACKVLALSGS